MTATINASTSSGLITTADTSGTLALQSNGTTQFTVSSTGAYGQLKSYGAIAATSGTSINFTSIPSWVKRITVMLADVSTSGTSFNLVQLGVAGTPQTTGYAGSYDDYTSTVGVSSISQTGFPYDTGASAAYITRGSFTLSLVGSNVWVISSLISSNPGRFAQCSGSVTLSGTLDMIRLTTVNGTDTFDAGSINIMYEG
jgi:hypothetical protein